MTKTSVYNYDDYRKFISSVVKARQSPWGIWSKISKAAGCRSTYLTQVMKGRAELTPDHVLGISRFFELNNDETQFFLLILEYGRAATKNLKEFLIKRIHKIQKEQEVLENKTHIARLEMGEKESIYYSSWYWSAIHVLISIPRYKTTVKISERLQLPLEQTKFALQNLVNHGLVKQERNQWTLTTNIIQIPKDSPVLGMHHQNWRNRAVQDLTNPLSDGVHFTDVSSMSLQDARKIKSLLLDLIEKNKRTIAPSQKEEVFCLNLDFFKV